MSFSSKFKQEMWKCEQDFPNGVFSGWRMFFFTRRMIEDAQDTLCPTRFLRTETWTNRLFRNGCLGLRHWAKSSDWKSIGSADIVLDYADGAWYVRCHSLLILLATSRLACCLLRHRHLHEAAARITPQYTTSNDHLCTMCNEYPPREAKTMRMGI